MSFPVAEEALEKTIDEVEDIVTPWDVEANKLTGIDYDKLIRMSSSILNAYIYHSLIKVVLVHQKSHRS